MVSYALRGMVVACLIHAANPNLRQCVLGAEHRCLLRAVSYQEKTETDMSVSYPTPAEVVSSMHVAFRKRDLEAIAQYWDDDITYEGPGVKTSGKAERIACEKEWLEAFTDNDVKVLSSFERGDEVEEVCILEGTHSGRLPLPGGVVLPPTHRRIAVQFASHYQVRDGKVVAQQIIFDRMAVMEQLQGAG